MPASWSPGGYTALLVSEMPDVRFDEVMSLTRIRKKKTAFAIDPRFIEVCEPNTIQVCGCTVSEPIAIGSSVVGGDVVIKLSRARKEPVDVVVRLTGIRRGFMGYRFPDRTREQFIANEKFINSAYPGSKS